MLAGAYIVHKPVQYMACPLMFRGTGLLDGYPAEDKRGVVSDSSSMLTHDRDVGV